MTSSRGEESSTIVSRTKMSLAETVIGPPELVSPRIHHTRVISKSLLLVSCQRIGEFTHKLSSSTPPKTGIKTVGVLVEVGVIVFLGPSVGVRVER